MRRYCGSNAARDPPQAGSLHARKQAIGRSTIDDQPVEIALPHRPADDVTEAEP
jgi:hypothetical protein